MDKRSLLEFACNNSISLKNEEITKYNVDEMLLWCEMIESGFDCNKILGFWNICSDVAKGLTAHFVGDEKKYNSLYEKIFLGNNIINISSKEYIPNFSLIEMKSIKEIMKNGINLIKGSLRCVF